MALLTLTDAYSATYTRQSDGVAVLSPIAVTQTDTTSYNDADGSEIQGPVAPGAVNVDLSSFTGNTAAYMYIESSDAFSAAFSGMAAPGIAALKRILVQGTGAITPAAGGGT